MAVEKSEQAKEDDGKLPAAFFIINVLFVVCSAASSIYRARGDRWELGYIVLVYGNLMGLIVCLRMLDRRRTEGMKMACCGFMTALCGSTVWGVAGTMGFGVVGKIVCAVVVAFAFAGCGLFVLMLNYRFAKEEDEEKVVVGKGGKAVLAA